MAEKMVRIFDPETKAVTNIPLRELAPGMIRAQVEGFGEVFVEASKLKGGGYRHPPFSEKLREMLSEIQSAFHDVYPKTLEEWEDGFRRDVHAEQELAVWIYMAKTFRHFTDGREPSADQRKDIFDVIVACVNNGSIDAAMATVSPNAITRNRARRIATYVFKNRSQD